MNNNDNSQNYGNSYSSPNDGNNKNNEYIQKSNTNNNIKHGQTQRLDYNPTIKSSDSYSQQYQNNVVNQPFYKQNHISNINEYSNTNSNQRNDYKTQQSNNYYTQNKQYMNNNGYNPLNSPSNNSNTAYQPQRSVVNIPQRIYDKIDTVFVWLAIALGFLFILMIGSLWFDFGIGATIFFEISFTVSYCYTIKKKIKVDVFHNILFFLLMILSLSFSFFSNSLALGANFLFITFAHAYWFYSIGEKKDDNFLNEIMTSIFIYPFMNYGALFDAILKKKKNHLKGNLKWILLGLCIALPLVCVVSSLLITSDEMFKIMFATVFDVFLSKVLRYFGYLIVGLPIAMAIFSVWYTKYTEDKKTVLSNRNISNFSNKNKVVTNYRIAPPELMYAISIPLCCVYFLYLISQISYFISFIADNLLPKDYTIVDYARNGFFELCAVTFINVLLISLLLLLTKRPNNVMPIGLRVITVLMSIFTLIFIGTALYKMFMYIKGYGFTPARINAIIFMSFLLIIFILIIANQFFKNMKFPATVIIVAIVFMLGYNIIDVDSFVVKQNIKLYKEDKIPWMGMSLVYDLDYSALEYLAPFASEENNGLDSEENDSLDRELRYRYDEYNKSYKIDSHEDLFSFNFNEYRVHKILQNYGYDEDYTFDYNYDYDYDYDL